MPVTGTPVNPVIISTDQIRVFLRDKSEKNILLADVQFTQKEVDQAISFAVDNFNAITPQSNYDPTSFPNRYLLLIGTAKYLMLSETFLQIRNQATYQDGDIAPIGIDDKQAAYAQLFQLVKSEWDELSRGIKTQNNMESAYNALGSGYRNTSRFNH